MIQIVYGVCSHDAECYFVGERDNDNAPVFKHCECVSIQSATEIAVALQQYRNLPGLPIAEDFADK